MKKCIKKSVTLVIAFIIISACVICALTGCGSKKRVVSDVDSGRQQAMPAANAESTEEDFMDEFENHTEHTYIGLVEEENGETVIKVPETFILGTRGVFYLHEVELPDDISVGDVVSVSYYGKADWKLIWDENEKNAVGYGTVSNYKVELYNYDYIEGYVSGYYNQFIEVSPDAEPVDGGPVDSIVFSMEGAQPDREGVIPILFDDQIKEEGVDYYTSAGSRIKLYYDRETMETLGYELEPIK